LEAVVGAKGIGTRKWINAVGRGNCGLGYPRDDALVVEDLKNRLSTDIAVSTAKGAEIDDLVVMVFFLLCVLVILLLRGQPNRDRQCSKYCQRN
jgi:hypothetical protein